MRRNHQVHLLPRWCVPAISVLLVASASVCAAGNLGGQPGSRKVVAETEAFVRGSTSSIVGTGRSKLSIVGTGRVNSIVGTGRSTKSSIVGTGRTNSIVGTGRNKLSIVGTGRTNSIVGTGRTLAR